MVVHHIKLKIKNRTRNRICKPFFVSFTLFVLIAYFSPFTSDAAITSNSDYSIEFDQINTEIPEPTIKPKLIKDETPSLPSFDQPTYSIESTNDAFSLAISQTAIDFGALTATNPVVRSSEILFSTPLYGAQIITYSNHQLLDTAKNVLPDTTCDTGTCSQAIPAIWENNLTYGFGFKCESSSKDVCGKNFSASSSFKQFPDTSSKESPQSIMLNQQGKQMTLGKVTYKVNISGTQAIGGYSNTITYIAIPNF